MARSNTAFCFAVITTIAWALMGAYTTIPGVAASLFFLAVSLFIVSACLKGIDFGEEIQSFKEKRGQDSKYTIKWSVAAGIVFFVICPLMPSSPQIWVESRTDLIYPGGPTVLVFLCLFMSAVFFAQAIDRSIFNDNLGGIADESRNPHQDQ